MSDGTTLSSLAGAPAHSNGAPAERPIPTRICFPFVGDDLGGSHVSAAKLIMNLPPDRFSPLIVLHEGAGKLADYLRGLGLDFLVLEGMATLAPQSRKRTGPAVAAALSYCTKTLPGLCAFLKRHKIDIVHTNDGRIHATWTLAARLSGAKHLWHHRADPEAKGVNLLAPLFADHIATVSDFARPARPILSVAKKTSVVYSPFDHPERLPERSAEKQRLCAILNCDPGTLLLGYFGLLIERKQPVAFVDIVHAFKKRHPEIPVAGLLFGLPATDGPRLDIAVAERARALGIEENIHLMGYRQPVEPYMAATDILVVPALNEPFGRTLIEAMFLETPVVAANHGGNREAIDNGVNGYLADPGDAETFVDPIYRLAADPAVRRRIADTARETAIARYGTRQHVEGITAIYDRLIRSR